MCPVDKETGGAGRLQRLSCVDFSTLTDKQEHTHQKRAGSSYQHLLILLADLVTQRKQRMTLRASERMSSVLQVFIVCWWLTRDVKPGLKETI